MPRRVRAYARRNRRVRAYARTNRRRRHPIHIYKRHNRVWRRYRGNPFRKNIKAGYYDVTGFHPIRSSPDYDPDRVDETYRYGRRGTETRGPRRRKGRRPAQKFYSGHRKTTKTKTRKRARKGGRHYGASHGGGRRRKRSR